MKQLLLAACLTALAALFYWPLAFCYFLPFFIRPKWSGAQLILRYDGHCALCHGAVRFVLSADGRRNPICFAPLADKAAGTVLFEIPGKVAERSEAAICVGQALGGWWRLTAIGASCLPRKLCDSIYNFIAARRIRFFGRTQEICPLVPPHLRNRFILK